MLQRGAAAGRQGRKRVEHRHEEEDGEEAKREKKQTEREETAEEEKDILKCLMSVESQSPGVGWEKITSILDSGAADLVMPRSCAKMFPIRPGKHHGRQYKTACGKRISNEGERKIKMYTTEGVKCDMTYQVADIERPLTAVGKVCDQDNEVIFRKHGGIIRNIHSGVEIAFGRENGVYMLEGWMRTDEKNETAEEAPVFTGPGR